MASIKEIKKMTLPDLVREIERLKKDPKFRKEIKNFIKETT